MYCFLFKTEVLTVTAVFQSNNYCVKCVEGGPSTSRGFKSSSCIEPRRFFSEQLLNCLSIRTLTAAMVKLRIFRFQQPSTSNPALMQWWVLGGQIILIAMRVLAQLLVGPTKPDKSEIVTLTKRDTLVLYVWFGRAGNQNH